MRQAIAALARPQPQQIVRNGEKELPPMPRSRIEIYWNTADTASWESMARRQHDELLLAAGKEGIGADNEGANATLHHANEGLVDVVLGAGDQHLEPEPERVRCGLSFLGFVLGNLVVRVREICDCVAVGTSSRSTSNLLAMVAIVRKVTPVRLAPGRLRLTTSPNSTGLAPLAKTIGITEVAALAANAKEAWPKKRPSRRERIQSSPLRGLIHH